MEVASEDFAPHTKTQTTFDSGPCKVVLRSRPEEMKRKYSKSKATKDFDLPFEIDAVFARASNLMREAIGADGVLFLDANLPDATKQREQTDYFDLQTTDYDTSTSAYPSGAESAVDSQHIGSDSDVPQPSAYGSQPCDILGFSTRVKSSLAGSVFSKKQLSLSRDFMQCLVQNYPHGKVINFAESGNVHSSSGGEGSSASGGTPRKSTRKMSRVMREAAVLSDVLSGVRTLAFLPLWDVRYYFRLVFSYNTLIDI